MKILTEKEKPQSGNKGMVRPGQSLNPQLHCTREIVDLIGINYEDDCFAPHAGTTQREARSKHKGL